MNVLKRSVKILNSPTILTIKNANKDCQHVCSIQIIKFVLEKFAKI